MGHIVTDAAGNGQGSAVVRPEAIVPRADGAQCVYYTSAFGVKAGEDALRAVAMDARTGPAESSATWTPGSRQQGPSASAAWC